MKLFKLISALLTVSVVAFYAGCTDTAPSEPAAGLGSVTITSYVAIGNSLPAGYQSNAWYESSQIYSYPNLLATQLRVSGANVTFVQPLWSDPGTPIEGTNIPSQYFVLSLVGPKIGPDFTKTAGGPKNLAYAAPYNNLAIPGAFIYDFLNAKDSSTCFSAFGGVRNPLFTTTLRGLGTQFQQAKILRPNLVTFELGDNDVLAYATSGGASPITPAATFQQLFFLSMDSLRTALGPNAIIMAANIPEVTSIPFATTIPSRGLVLTQAQADGLNAATGGVFQFTAGVNGFLAFTGTGSPANPTPVKKLTASDYVLLTCPQDSLKSAGWGSLKPIPGIYVLDAAEISASQNAVAAYNAAVNAIAAQFNVLVVDIHGLLASIDQQGVEYAGQTLTSDYVVGGVFSLDGVHPTSKGQGLMANEFIKVLNAKTGTSIPYVDIGSLPGIPVALTKYSFAGKPVPYIPVDALQAMQLNLW